DAVWIAELRRLDDAGEFERGALRPVPAVVGTGRSGERRRSDPTDDKSPMEHGAISCFKFTHLRQFTTTFGCGPCRPGPLFCRNQSPEKDNNGYQGRQESHRGSLQKAFQL